MLGNITLNQSYPTQLGGVNKKNLAIIVLPFHFFISWYGNGFLVLVLWKMKKKWNSVNTMIFYISICNLVLTSIPSLTNLLEMFWNRWLLTTQFCYFSTFTQYLFLVASHFMCVAIAQERYRAISDPLKQYAETKWHGRFTIASVWLFASIIAISTTITHSPGARIGPNQDACLNTWIHFTWQHRNVYAIGAVALSAVLFILPMTYMAIIYTILVAKLLHRRQPGDNKSRGSLLRKRKQNLSIAAMLLITVVLYQAFWLPTVALQIAFITSLNGRLTQYVYDLDTLVSTIAFCYCAINPWIYICFIKIFRQSLKSSCQRKPYSIAKARNRTETGTSSVVSADQMITQL